MIRLLHGDCRSVLRTLPDASVHCCVTSPPYWGLRRYTTGQYVVVRFRQEVSEAERARVVAELATMGVRPI